MVGASYRRAGGPPLWGNCVVVLSLVLGLVLGIVYSSFAEWFVHKYGMHTQKISKWSFQRHAIGHHSIRRSLKTFYAVDVYKIWDSSAIPLLWLIHVPLYLLVGYLWNRHAGIGFAIGTGCYVAFYEVLHFHIHTPRGHWFQRTRLFHLWCEYHRVHHHRARWNYNVVLPIADLALGTYSLAQMPPEPSAPPEAARYTGPASVFGRNGVPLVAAYDPYDYDEAERAAGTAERK